MLSRLKLLEKIEIQTDRVTKNTKKDESVSYERPLHSVPGLVACINIQPLPDRPLRLSITPQPSALAPAAKMTPDSPLNRDKGQSLCNSASEPEDEVRTDAPLK